MSSESSVKLIEDWRDRWEAKANWDVVAVAETPIGIRVWASYKDYPISTYPQGDILIPKPRPKTYRPWRREEVPVDEWFRNNSSNNIFRIEGICSNGDVFIAGGWCSLNDLSTNWRIHRTTEYGEWVPVEQCPKCGVEE